MATSAALGVFCFTRFDVKRKHLFDMTTCISPGFSNRQDCIEQRKWSTARALAIGPTCKIHVIHA